MRHTIICVHGTFASASGETGGAWWQKDGAIAKALARNRVLARHFQFSDKCFHWSGLNSLHAREEAAEKLLEFLCEFERNKTPYHLLGHSHGGSIIWAMLRRVAATPEIDLNHLESWMSVGTPFLALKQTFLGRVSAKLLIWITAILLGLFFMALGLLALHKFAPIDAMNFVPQIDRKTLALGAIALFPLLLYSHSKWKDHKPDPGSVIVNTERRELLERFVSKWFGLWSARDEAIAALRTSLSDKIAPLARRPLVNQSIFGSNPLFIRTIFAMPSRIVWNLIFRPVGNKFMRETVRASSLGIDRPGIEATGIEPWPRIFGNMTEFPALPNQIDKDLQESADRILSKCAPTLRKLLTDVSVGIDANAALSPETIALLPSALVHTSYFENRFVLELIFRWLLLQKGATTLDAQKIMARNYIGTFIDERRRLEKTLLNPA